MLFIWHSNYLLLNCAPCTARSIAPPEIVKIETPLGKSLNMESTHLLIAYGLPLGGLFLVFDGNLFIVGIRQVMHSPFMKWNFIVRSGVTSPKSRITCAAAWSTTKSCGYILAKLSRNALIIRIWDVLFSGDRAERRLRYSYTWRTFPLPPS